MRLLFISVSLVTLLAGCGGGESAGEAVEDLVESFSESDYAAAYDSLHPDHQALVAEDRFVDCSLQAQEGANPVVDEIDITSENEVTRNVPELGEVEVTVVGVDLTQGNEIFPRTWDVIKVDGDWRWLLAEELLIDYREGRCPGEAASAST
ncbi:MAG: DUF4878 domain-containing protein [Thermomicrobiales bacterium]